jgi:propionate CoA-transferase
VELKQGHLKIVREGKVRKFVNQATHITYRVFDGVKRRGQTAKIITERAVFLVDSDGLTLTELAPGIDLQTQILDQMDYAPVRIAQNLKWMDLTRLDPTALPALAAI